MNSDATCPWCGEPATATRELEPEKLDRRTGEVVRPARTVDVCPRHAAVIDRDVEIARIRARLSRRQKRLDTTVVRDREAVEHEQTYDRAQLERLEAS